MPTGNAHRHLSYLGERGLSPNTIYLRRRNLWRLYRWLTEHGAEPTGQVLCEASPEILAAWRASLTVSNDTIATTISHVREFYRWAVRAGLIESSPAEALAAPKVARRLPRPIGEDALLYAVQAAPPRIRPWLVLAGWAGLRACEIAYLRRPNVLETARPPVLVIAFDATKGRRERVVPMSDFVVAELAPVLPSSGWVFRRADGQPGPNKPWIISALANKHLHECGCRETLHQLRHRFLTSAYKATHDLRLVQELAGHASPLTTAGYAAYSKTDALAAVQAVPAPGARRLRSVTRSG